MWIRAIATAFCCWSLSASAYGATLIHAARLVDGRNGQVQSEMTIVIDAGRIADVVAGYAAPQHGDQVIELREHTVMPGLMDMHTHLMSPTCAMLQSAAQSDPEIN